MLHLLPQYQKRKVINEYRIRLVVVLVVIFIAVVFVFGISLIPSYLALKSEKDNLLSQKNGYETTIQAGSVLVGEGGVDVSKAVASLKPYENSLSPILFIDAINKAANGVQIDAYSFVQTKAEEPVSTTVSGFARSREGLSAVSKSLNEVFGNVKLPLSSLAKQSDIPFEFRFQMMYPKVVDYLKQEDKSKAE